MYRIQCILLAIFFSHSAQAGNYNKALLMQYAEEQSYSLVVEYGNSIPLSDRDNYLYNIMGNAAYQMGLLSQSSSFYQSSFELDSNNIQANLYLGIIKKQQRNHQTALTFFRRLHDLKPAQSRYLKLMSECFTALSQKDSAYHYLGKAYAIAPNDLSIKLSLAELLYEMKNYTEVDVLVNEGLALDSGHVALLSLGIRSAYFQKHYNELLPMVNKLSKMGLGESIFTPMMFGIFASLQLKDYHQCIEYSEYLMRNGSESEQVYYYAAKAYTGLKEYEKSNELLKRCLAMAISENTEAYYTEMAENYEALKVYSKAQKNYDTARFISGNNLLLYRKALAYEAVSDTEKAKKAYRDFLKLSRDEDTAIVNFAKKRITEL